MTDLQEVRIQKFIKRWLLTATKQTVYRRRNLRTIPVNLDMCGDLGEMTRTAREKQRIPQMFQNGTTIKGEGTLISSVLREHSWEIYSIRTLRKGESR
jgi:hypothetical protein